MDYQAYMLSLWLANSGDGRTWRASLEDPRTGERQAFADLEALFAFLQERTSGPLANEPGWASPHKKE
jgi:hypothetical protein